MKTLRALKAVFLLPAWFISAVYWRRHYGKWVWTNPLVYVKYARYNLLYGVSAVAWLTIAYLVKLIL